MEFVKRTTAPTKDNKYYGSSTYCPFVGTPYNMFNNNGNCTHYAYARMSELMGKKSDLPTGNAGTWYSKASNLFAKGPIPKVGAVAVWHKDGYSADKGHVAVVERVDSNGDFYASNSGWKSTLFYMQTYKKSSNYSWKNRSGQSYTLLGFIYCPIEFDNEVPKQEWTTGKYKLLVAKAIRTSHDLSDNIVKVGRCMASVKPNLTSSNPNDKAHYKVDTVVNITEIYKDNENRIWGKLQNCWIVLCNSDGTPQAEKI